MKNVSSFASAKLLLSSKPKPEGASPREKANAKKASRSVTHKTATWMVTGNYFPAQAISFITSGYGNNPINAGTWIRSIATSDMVIWRKTNRIEAATEPLKLSRSGSPWRYSR